MASEILTKRAASVRVVTGTSASGNSTYTNISLGSLNKDAWDAGKALAIVSALEPCLDNNIDSVPMTATYAVVE